MEFLDGGMEELKIMLNDLKTKEESINNVNKCASEGKRLEKSLQQEKDNLEKDINATLKSELANVTVEEDRIISDNNRRLREVKSNRNKAKDKRIKDRIENETKALVEENRDLHRFIRQKFKENNLPSYCDTKWFYALYCTEGYKEWIVKILVFIMGLVVIPFVVVELIDPWWFLKIIIWAIVVVAFVGLYITVYLLTKDRDIGILEEMRSKRYKLLDNEKEIKRIKKGIKTDSDESHYNLNEFDEEIEALQNNIEQTTKAREGKLKDFEENKKQQIIDKVNENHAEAIESIQDAIDNKSDEYKAATDKANEIQKQVAENYEKYLTPQYTNRQSCEKMQELITSGQAENIRQALQIIQNNK